jgi:hypothetical protein
LAKTFDQDVFWKKDAQRRRKADAILTWAGRDFNPAYVVNVPLCATAGMKMVNYFSFTG